MTRFPQGMRCCVFAMEVGKTHRVDARKLAGRNKCCQRGSSADSRLHDFALTSLGSECLRSGFYLSRLLQALDALNLLNTYCNSDDEIGEHTVVCLEALLQYTTMNKRDLEGLRFVSFSVSCFAGIRDAWHGCRSD